MSDRPSCRRRSLAHNQAGQVQQCSCGTVHLSIGPTTLRLPAEAIPVLRQLLDRATRRIESESLPNPAAPGREDRSYEDMPDRTPRRWTH